VLFHHDNSGSGSVPSRPVSTNWLAKWFAKYNRIGVGNRGLIGHLGPPP
jgi:hypothetical protein